MSNGSTMSLFIRKKKHLLNLTDSVDSYAPYKDFFYSILVIQKKKQLHLYIKSLWMVVRLNEKADYIVYYVYAF